MSAHHGRDQIQYIDIATDREGNVKGLRCRILADMGAYLRLVSPGIPILGAFMYVGIYKFPAYRFECQGVFTNKVPTDAYRGAGRPEATFAVERIMDELAVELGMDPLELRRKNWIGAEEFPYTTAAGLEYDSGDYEAATQKALELLGLRRAARRAAAPPGVQRPGPARHRHLHVHRDVRAGAFAGARLAVLRRRRLGARLDPDAAHRQGRGRHGDQPARAGPRDGVEPARGRPARRPVRGHRGAARRHRGLRPWTGHLRVALPGRGRRGGGERRGEGGGQGPRVAAHLLEANEDDLEFSGGSSPSGGRRAARSRSRRSRWRPSRRTTSPRAWSPRSTPTRRSTP